MKNQGWRAFIPSRWLVYLRKLRAYIFDVYAVKSYSQEGEDMILQRIFDGQLTGYYVDVGAHHPKRFSNTYIFYKNGWKGINIDAMPGSMRLFNKIRPRDINIEVPISDKKQVLTYYAFNEPALNGFSKQLSTERDAMENYFIESTYEIETSTLEEILDNNIPTGQPIDFLSIDVEGLDFNVLVSNDFEKHTPKVILIEVLENSLENIVEHQITLYLKKYNYFVYAKTVNTVIFMQNVQFGSKEEK